MYSLIKMPLTHLHPPSLSSLFHPPPHTCICTWFLLSLQKDAVVFFFVLHAWINGYQYSFFIQIMPTRDREAEKVRKEKCGLKNKKQQQKNNKSKTGCNKLQLEKAEAQKKEWEYFKEALNKRSDASLQQTVFCTHIVSGFHKWGPFLQGAGLQRRVQSDLHKHQRYGSSAMPAQAGTRCQMPWRVKAWHHLANWWHAAEGFVRTFLLDK